MENVKFDKTQKPVSGCIHEKKATTVKEKKQRQFAPHVDGRRTKPQLTELGYAAKLK